MKCGKILWAVSSAKKQVKKENDTDASKKSADREFVLQERRNEFSNHAKPNSMAPKRNRKTGTANVSKSRQKIDSNTAQPGQSHMAYVSPN